MNSMKKWLAPVLAAAAAASFPPQVSAAQGLTLSWTNNLLTLASPDLPGRSLDIRYLEAFCRKGSTKQDWGKTTIPHSTILTASDPSGKWLRFRTLVSSNILVTHELRAGADEGGHPV